MKKQILSSSLLLIAILLSSILINTQVSASGRTAAMNSIEADRKAQCNVSSQTNTVFGAVWVNGEPTSSTSNARWSENLTVNHNDTLIDATLWTTAFVCSHSPYNVVNAEIFGLSPATGGSIPISFPYGTSVYRGNANKGYWTDRVPSTTAEDLGVLRVRLNVSSVPADGTRRCYTFAYHGTYRDGQGTGMGRTYTNDICITKRVPPWSISPYSTVTRGSVTTTATLNAFRGDTVTFRHYLQNPTSNNSQTVSWSAQARNDNSGAWSNWANVATGSRTVPASTGTPGVQVNSNGFTVPSNARFGARYCQSLNASPASSTNSGQIRSNAPCVTIVANPELTPYLEVTQPGSTVGSGIIVPGSDSVRVTTAMTNSGSSNEYPTSFGLARFVLRAGTNSNIPQPGARTVTNISPSGDFMCRFTPSSPGIVRSLLNMSVVPPCETLYSRVYSQNQIPVGSGLLGQYVNNLGLSGIPNLALGDKVCYVAAINRYNNTASDRDWRRTNVICLTVAKVPLATVSGGDLAVRGTLAEAAKLIRGYSYATGGYRYGSWAEYGIFGPSSIDMHSGGTLAMSNANPDNAGKNNLVFANTGGGTPGRFIIAGAASVADYDWSKLGIDTSVTAVSGVGNHTVTAGPANSVRTYTGSGVTRISGGTVPRGETYVISARTGTIRISGNINYAPGQYNTAGDLPQVIIIARNIVIDEDVNNIDAWLIAAGGNINTCGSAITPSPYYSGLTSNSCRDPLRVNGIVQADRIFLRRTAGATSSSSDSATRDRELRSPAEVFNARPDTYLWAHGRSASQGVVRTESVRELPPRF